MSRDGIVLDTALVVAIIVVLALMKLLGSEVAEIAGWQQSSNAVIVVGLTLAVSVLIAKFSGNRGDDGGS